MDLAKHQRRPRLELKLRHHPDNLHALYRESEDPVERSRWHAIWLLATGHSIPEVAQTLGYSTRWVRDTLWMKRLGFAPLRPRHRDRDWEEGEAFKKTLLHRSPPEVPLPLAPAGGLGF